MPHTCRQVALVLVVVLLSAYLPVPAQAQAVSLGERVYVLGAVKKPGDFEFKPGMDVKQAVEVAGGLAETADLTGVILIRENGEKSSLNIQAIMNGTEKVALAGGDTVIVKPKSNVAVTPVVTPAVAPVVPAVRTFNASITGEVNQPGAYSLEQGKTDNFESLLQKAGGATAKADLKRVRVSSVSGEERLTKIVDASSASGRQMLMIQGEDAVFVPQTEEQIKRRRVTLNDVYLGTVILYTLVRIFRND